MKHIPHSLLQINDSFVSDGGLETFLVFQKGWDLPENAAFVLLESEEGQKTLVEYYRRYISIARKYNVDFILESPTWRASAGWLEKLRYPQNAVIDINHRAIKLLQEIRDDFEKDGNRIIISGNLGPRGDGYVINDKMSPEQAEAYHVEQIMIFCDTNADLVSAYTINYADEAIGIVRAAQSANMPVVVSFTVETDGRLPSGESLAEAISMVDNATQSYCEYYMVNCSHPTHVEKALATGESWMERVRGVRSNSSAKSHEELEALTELDDGNPVEFGEDYVRLKGLLPHLNVMGGCCGTDHRHIEEICRAIFKE